MGDVQEPKFNKPDFTNHTGDDYERLDNKELFKREYICKWGISEEYKKAYELWVDYNYQCERYDQFVCTGGFDKYGFVRPANSFEFHATNDNALILRNALSSKAKLYNLSSEHLKQAKRDVERLNSIGLQMEYDRLFKSI